MPVVRFPSRVPSIIFIIWIILSCYPGLSLSAVVTLDSIQIFKTHEWIQSKPTVYFLCQGENKTVLPDVKEVQIIYSFKGEESFQPLTELSDKKCKRCGFYELDNISSDDVFDEWEFCPSDFTAPDGKYIHFKDKEVNATFSCPECVVSPKTAPIGSGSDSGSQSGGKGKGKGMHIFLVIMIGVVVSTVSIVMFMVGYKYWQKKKRMQDQARFLKLFEDGDDIEDELGLGDII